jgi:hypothetical protein
MNNILDLLNIGSPGMSAGLGAGSVPAFAPGAQQFGASTISPVSGMSMSNLMPYLTQLLGSRQGHGMPTLPNQLLARPGETVPMRLIASNPNFPSWFGETNLS